MKPLRIAPQSGVTLAEILVGLSLSIIFSNILVQLFSQSKINSKIEQNFARMHEEAYFLVDHFSRVAKTAGHRTPPTANSMLYYSDFSTVFPAATPYVSGTNNLGTNSSDTVTFRYQGSGDGLGTPDNITFDCLGNAVDGGDLATNTFSINSDLQLICQAVNETSGTTSSLVLVDNVETFHVLYGEDTNGDNNPDRYVESDFSGLNMNNVTSIRVSFLMRTPDAIHPNTDTKSYNLLDTTFDPVDDKRSRKIYTKTIQLRNVFYESF